MEGKEFILVYSVLVLMLFLQLECENMNQIRVWGECVCSGRWYMFLLLANLLTVNQSNPLTQKKYRYTHTAGKCLKSFQHTDDIYTKTAGCRRHVLFHVKFYKSFGNKMFLSV